MNNNIRKSILRLDGILLAFLMFFFGSMGGYGNIIVSNVAPISNESNISDYNPTQHHVSISINHENLELTEIEEEEVEEEAEKNASFFQQKNLTTLIENEYLIAQDDIYFVIPKPKKYLLFQALKLDC